ncbi:MAG: hypothetical protein ACXV97_10410 [Chthoniobacterales bacterium]
MQWFIGINEGCPAWKEYADIAKVAIHTALQHTSLEPHCLYDGGENEFTTWLRQREVRVIPWRTFLYNDLKKLGERRNNPDLLRATRGVFLRTELPQMQERFGFDDRVLYTDCDVIFRQEVVNDFMPLQPRYFSLAPESFPERPEEANTGVMWMNLPEMRQFEGERFQNYLRENIDGLPAISWDQGAYRNFYRSAEGAPLWETLAPELNWKPYWDDYSPAKIIHFHGPKPFQRPNIDSHYPELKFLTGGRYEEICDLWEELLREANESA